MTSTSPRFCVRKVRYFLLLALFLCASSHAQLVCTIDVNGPNDPAGDGQSDITQLCFDESGLPATFEVEFSWDDSSFSGKNTGDACVLFDLDGDAAGNIDYALCASVGGNPGSLVAGPTFYTCSGQPDRCGNATLIVAGGATTCSGATQNTDPFSSGDDFPNDTVVNCTVDTADIPAGWVRTNFCSFPSSQPNSDPKDCIGYLGGGFIEITKRAFPEDVTSAATSFSFSVSGTGTEQGTPVTVSETVIVNGNSSNAISVPQGGPYTVAEVGQNGWTTTEAVCDGGTVSGSTVTGIMVAASGTTHCEFSNLRSGSITIVKSASPADGTDFSFSGDLGSFTLDVDTSPTFSDNISFDSLAPGTYTVTEAATLPFGLDSIVCQGDTDSGSVVDLGQRQVAIDFDAAEAILCAFSNITGADIALTKALDTAGPYTVGQTVQYTLLVSNGGPSTATTVTVSDSPNNLTIDTVSSAPLGTCTALPCTLASLASGASETITVVATIDAVGAFDNAATVVAAELDPDPDNNTDDSGNGGTAAAVADIALTKALDTAGPYTVGQTVQYTLLVSNGGPSTATTVTVSDSPNNLTIDTVSSAPLGTCMALPCTLASLDSGASETITVVATIDAVGAFDNAATVVAAELDPDPDNNTDDSGNGGTAAAVADIALTKALDTAGPYTVGQTVQYTLLVSNGGPSTATTVTVSDSPNNLTIDTVSSAPLGTCTALPCTLASLASGASETITVVATIDAVGAFDNAATVVAAELDPDPDNNTDDSGNGGTAAAVADPVVGIAKTTGATTDHGDGTFTTTVTITLENLGNVVLRDVQVMDDLTAAFPAPATFSVSLLTSATLAVNGLYDGSADKNLLTGMDTLAIGAQATVNFNLTFDPMGLPGPFLNSASGTAQSDSGDVTTDISDDGTDPDANGNGDPGDPGEDDATPIAFTETPVLGVAKAASPTTDNGDGTFTTTITVTLENLGNVVLQDLQVNDNLSPAFPLPASFTVANVTSPLLSANTSFNGVGDTALLLGTDVLAVGQSTTVAFDLSFDPDVLSGPFFNSASGQAAGPGGAPTSDVSDEGNTPDANGDGDPGGVGEDDFTEIGFLARPAIGVAKAASPTRDNGDGTFTTTITLRVENLGNVILQELQISDDLSAAFPAPATVVVTSPTSSTLDIDAAFDGLGNQDLLLGTDSLGVGQTATASFNLTFDPAGSAGPFSNTAVASALSPAGTPTTDLSDSGSDPDPNADGDPGGPGEDDPTAITFIENPVLGVAKAASPTTDNSDGSFTTTITLTLENLGNVTLVDLQVSDDLGAAFPAPAAVSVANLTSPFLNLNPAYDGVSDINLLLDSESLPVASMATVTFDITFTPNGLAGPFSNMALGSAAGPAGTPTSDRSDNGTDTDSSGDGDPGGPGEDDPTSITFAENPVVDIAKSSSPSIDNLDGTFTTTITLLVENLGNVVLNDLAISDDLTATFPVAVSFSVANLNSVSLTTNPGFDGASDTDLLAGTDVLPVGGSATLAFDITFDPGALPGPFLNTAIASAAGPGGTSTSDRSNSGNDPDPNDDGDPSTPGEDTPTPITYVERPVLGVAKAAGPAVDNGNGTFTTTITVRLTNLGNVLLSDVQVIDDLSLAFPAPSTYTVSNLTSATLAANAAFDGTAVTALLAGTDTIAFGQSASVTFDVTFDPNGLPGPFLNSAQASGVGPNGTLSSDLSDSGNQPDANGNGDPGDPGENDPTVIDFTENPVLGVAKTVGATLDNGDGTFTTTVAVAVQNLGNVVLQNVQAVDDLTGTFPAPATFTVENVFSAALTVNPLFDGSNEINLLGGADNLAVGASAQVSFDITFNPQTLPGPFLNSATAVAQSPGGDMSSDLSDNGTEADANGNGDPGDPDENDPSPITFAENTVIGAAKTAEPAIDLGGGSFQTTVTLTVQNLGNVVLSGLAITDDLDAVIPAPATFSVSAIDSSDLTVNPAFDGDSDIQLLNGTDSLAVGETATVSFVLTFQPNGVAGPFENVVIAQATGPGGGISSDRSDNGTTTDSNGDGNPGGPGEDDPTPISFDAQPVIGAAKDATTSIDNGDGTFTTTVTLVIENLGNVVLSNIQISDDLLATFPSPATFVTGSPVSTSLTVNPGFDGAGSINLLSGTDTLAIGETASVSFELTFAPNGSIGPFSNTAIASATDAGGQPTSDRSAAGSDPDPNGDGNPSLPGVEDTPTQIDFTARTGLGIAKQAGPVVDNLDGTFTTTVTITLENLGNVVLRDVQVMDDLTAAFPAPATFSVSLLTSATLAVNGLYDGSADKNLLTGMDTLAIGAQATVNFNLTFDPMGLPGPFLNSASGTAQSDSGDVTTDISDDGTDPDANGNGDPGDPGEDDATPIAFTETPVLGVAKAASPTTDNGDGTFTTTITVTLENLGNVVLQDLQVNDNLSPAFPLPASFTVANVTSPLLSANTSFNGVGDTALLLGTDVLAVGQSTTVAFDLSFDPDVLSGPFFNSASGQAAGPGGAPTSDVSDEGNTPDANGDGDPGGVGEDDFTEIGFLARPAIGVAKAASPTRDNGDGTFTTTITLRVENLGNVILQELQISDDLSAAFPAPATVVVTSPTSSTLDIDAAFDGLGNQDLLLGTDSLGVGQTATASFNLTFDPAGSAGPFSNTAVASALSPAGTPTTDLSDSGSDPDPNADGDPGGPGEDDPTAITFIENPVLGVAKAASPTTDNSDGSFTTTITLTLENLGNVTLVDLQVSDDLGAAFPAPAAVSVANLTSPFLNLNPAYDGVSDINLLLGGESLPVASMATVTFDITFTPNGLAGPFSNMALGSAAGPAGTPTSDRSDNGTDTDSSGDGDPGGPGEDDPTSITFAENPVVDIAKSSSPSIDNLDGTFTTTITLLVENLGNVVLNDLAISDDLTATFPVAVSFSVANLNSVSLTTNPGFDGASDTDLLAGTDVLPVGGSATLAFDITFDPGALPGPFLNTAIASAAGPGGTSTSDRSNSGNDPDPNDDGDPSTPGEDTPTPITYVERPVLGVAKAAGPAVDNGNGTFTTTITVRLTNLGNVLLSDVQVIDDLSLAFPAPSTYTVSNLTSATLAANAAFDGTAVTALLAGTDTIAFGQSASVTFDVTFDPNGLPGPFLNSAQASGVGPNGTLSSDLSDSGNQPDANGNGDPGDPGENDPTVIDFTENPVLGVAKTVGATLDNGDGTFTTTVAVAVQNLGNVVLQNVQAVDDLTGTFPAPATFTVENVFSAALTVNPLFDGSNEINLLGGADNLAVGASAQVSFDITFNPQTLPGPFLNSATAVAQSPGGDMSSDLSDNGTEADANGNGDPGDPDENDPSPITFAENTVIGAAKTAEPAIDLGGGSFQTTVTLTVQNLGNVVLSGLAITDDLDAVIPAPATFSVSAIDSSDLTVNPAFDGDSDIQLLNGTDSLAVGETATVSFVLTFQPNGVAGPFENVVIAQATGPGGGISSDRSDNGTTTDSNGDGNPGGPGEDDPTPISFDAQPVIGAAKDATTSIDNGDGTFTTTVTLVIENLGNVVLSNIQISDDLLATFPSPATFVTGSPVSTSLTVNPGFDGAGSINLLSGTDTLAIGETASVSFELTFAPNGSIGPFSNTAIASATDAGGQPTSDRSAAGSDPDPNGDGNPSLPGVEDTPTQIDFTTTARTVLGIAKQAGPMVDNLDGTFSVSLTMFVENLGNVVLIGVQVSDDLRNVFPVPIEFMVSGLASSTLSVNSSFDGDSDINMLLGTDSLGPGMIADVSFDLLIVPTQLSGRFNNFAIADAQTSQGAPVTDISTDGSDPDPDGNGDPSEMDPTPLPIPTAAIAIPALNWLGLLMLILLLSSIPVWRLRT